MVNVALVARPSTSAEIAAVGRTLRRREPIVLAVFDPLAIPLARLEAVGEDHRLGRPVVVLDRGGSLSIEDHSTARTGEVNQQFFDRFGVAVVQHGNAKTAAQQIPPEW